MSTVSDSDVDSVIAPAAVTSEDLGNQKRIVYSSEELKRKNKKADFTHGICCILLGDAAALEDKDSKRVFDCIYSTQLHAIFVYDKHDEIISEFVQLKYKGTEDMFGGADILIVIPHCLSRASALYREAVIKAKIDNAWICLNTEEVTVDEYKDSRFVQAKFSGGIPSFVCVISRYKKDTIRFVKQTSRNTSSVDQRLSLKSEYGCFSGKNVFTMQVQPVDTNTVNRIQHTVPDGRSMMCSSNIVSINWAGHTFKKSITVNLPIPANPAKLKKLAKAEAAKTETNTEKDRRRRAEYKKEEKVNKWYMGIYGDDEHDVLYLFYFDVTADMWTHMPDIKLTEIRKDLISFQTTRPLYRFVVLRCRTDVLPADARKLVYTLEEQLSLRAVRFILVQNPREHSEVTVHCVSASKYESLYDELYDHGWRFYGTKGPPSSREVRVKEGTVFDVGFRGNVKFDERFHPFGKKVVKYYNSQMPCQITFLITEADRHLQKNYDFFKGVCMIQNLDKKYDAEANQIHLDVRSKSSTGSQMTHLKKASSNIGTERKRVLCELMLQLAKGFEQGPHTPPAGKFNMKIHPTSLEGIELLSSKLGKEWEVLARNLGLTRGRVEALKTRNKGTPDLIKQDMLYTWIKRQPRASDNLPKLYHALMNCGRIDLAYKIEDLYYGPDPPVEITVTEDVDKDLVPISDATSTINKDNINVTATSILSSTVDTKPPTGPIPAAEPNTGKFTDEEQKMPLSQSLKLSESNTNKQTTSIQDVTTSNVTKTKANADDVKLGNVAVYGEDVEQNDINTEQTNEGIKIETLIEDVSNVTFGDLKHPELLDNVPSLGAFNPFSYEISSTLYDKKSSGNYDTINFDDKVAAQDISKNTEYESLVDFRGPKSEADPVIVNLKDFPDAGSRIYTGIETNRQSAERLSGEKFNMIDSNSHASDFTFIQVKPETEKSNVLNAHSETGTKNFIKDAENQNRNGSETADLALANRAATDTQHGKQIDRWTSESKVVDIDIPAKDSHVESEINLNGLSDSSELKNGTSSVVSEVKNQSNTSSKDSKRSQLDLGKSETNMEVKSKKSESVTAAVPSGNSETKLDSGISHQISSKISSEITSKNTLDKPGSKVKRKSSAGVKSKVGSGLVVGSTNSTGNENKLNTKKPAKSDGGLKNQSDVGIRSKSITKSFETKTGTRTFSKSGTESLRKVSSGIRGGQMGAAEIPSKKSPSKSFSVSLSKAPSRGVTKANHRPSSGKREDLQSQVKQSTKGLSNKPDFKTQNRPDVGRYVVANSSGSMKKESSKTRTGISDDKTSNSAGGRQSDAKTDNTVGAEYPDKDIKAVKMNGFSKPDELNDTVSTDQIRYESEAASYQPKISIQPSPKGGGSHANSYETLNLNDADVYTTLSTSGNENEGITEQVNLNKDSNVHGSSIKISEANDSWAKVNEDVDDSYTKLNEDDIEDL